MPEHKLLPSPGNAYSEPTKDMKIPHMAFIYRLECEMSPDRQAPGPPFGSAPARLIMPIVGGTFAGPHLSGTIEPTAGADWATSIPGTTFTRLDARYTLRTADGHFIYVRSKGVFSPTAESRGAGGQRPTSVSQDDAEWFTRLQFEAGPGPHNWLNGVFGIGVLTMHGGKIVIDAYRLTNFPHESARDIRGKM